MAYLVLNADAFDNLEESLTQPHTVVCIVNSCEAEKATLDLPLGGTWLLDPMASNCEVPISIASLPCIACYTDFAGDCWTLDRE